MLVTTMNLCLRIVTNSKGSYPFIKHRLRAKEIKLKYSYNFSIISMKTRNLEKMRQHTNEEELKSTHIYEKRLWACNLPS